METKTLKSLFIIVSLTLIFSCYYVVNDVNTVTRRLLPIPIQLKFTEYGTIENEINFREGQITWVDPPGSFMERLLPYNEALNDLRTQLSRQSHLPWRDLNDDITILDGIKDELLHVTINTKLYTLALKRHNMSHKGGGYTCRNDTSNYLVQKYYMSSSIPPYCDYVKRQPNYSNSQLLLIYKCNENLTRSQTPECLKPIDHYSAKVVNHKRKTNSSFPEYYLNNYPEYIFYINALHDGVVNADGYVFTQSVKIVDVVCQQKYSVNPPKNYANSSLYPEVFVISQHWGHGYFHKQGEDIPRIAPYLPFLTKNKAIKIHVKETRSVTAETLKMLGINPERLVKGDIRAKIVYIPQATNCGYSNQHSVQLLSRLYRRYVERNITDNRRNSIVMIHRTKKRLLVDYDKKERAMREIAEDYNLTFEVLSDNALPSFLDQVKLFHRAAVVIGSHGAGLVNMIFSEPGTLVVEGTCSPPGLVMCYVRLAHVLGHYYHAIPSLGKWTGSVNIKTDTFITEAKKIIDAHFTRKN